MSITRAPRPRGNFYILDKTISEDRRLTWGARGLLIYLLGKPDHWQVSTQALISETQGSRNPTGRDAVRAMLGELIAAGYMQRIPARSDDGRLSGYDYSVSETCDSPGIAPETDYPAPVEPGPANPPLVSTDEKARTELDKGDDAKPDDQPPPDSPKPPKKTKAKPEVKALPDWLPMDAWNGWLDMRRKANKVPTQRAIDLSVRQLENLRAEGQDVEKVLDQSTVRGWTGLFSVRPEQQQAARAPRRAAAPAPKSFQQQEREVGWKRWEEMTGRIHPDRIAAEQAQAGQDRNIIDITPINPQAPLLGE